MQDAPFFVASHINVHVLVKRKVILPGMTAPILSCLSYVTDCMTLRGYSLPPQPPTSNTSKDCNFFVWERENLICYKLQE